MFFVILRLLVVVLCSSIHVHNKFQFDIAHDDIFSWIVIGSGAFQKTKFLQLKNFVCVNFSNDTAVPKKDRFDL